MKTKLLNIILPIFLCQFTWALAVDSVALSVEHYEHPNVQLYGARVGARWNWNWQHMAQNNILFTGYWDAGLSDYVAGPFHIPRIDIMPNVRATVMSNPDSRMKPFFEGGVGVSTGGLFDTEYKDFIFLTASSFARIGVGTLLTENVEMSVHWKRELTIGKAFVNLGFITATIAYRFN